MFGYIKPFIPDLRVREHEMYRAIYCGLCRSMGRHTGCASRLTLSYDFTFLCAVRMAFEKTKKSITVTRCAASPMKSRPIMDDNPALAYCACVAAILTREKVNDDINDSKGAARLKAKFLLPPANAMAKKAIKYDSSFPVSEIEKELSALSRLEKENHPSIDTVADSFGKILSIAFSYGLHGFDKDLARDLGLCIGRIIYVLDAADDREKDLITGNYNPLNIESVSSEALSNAIRLELSKAERAVSLMDFDGMPELHEIILNVIYEGIPKEADRIFSKKSSKP